MPDDLGCKREEAAAMIEWLLNGSQPSDAATDVNNAPPEHALRIEAGGWAEAGIPHRPWIAPGYLIRQALTVIVGAPSAGKSSLTLAFAAALVFGTECGRFRPCRPYRAALLNVEDDLNEQHRRLSGVLRRMGKTPADLGDRLALIYPKETGALLERDVRSNKPVPTAALEELLDYIREQAKLGHPIDVLILDPFVELHGAEENDNTAVRAVMACFRAIAVEHNIAIVILHHTRKAGAVAGDPDASRGASAIIGAARIVLTVTSMLGAEASALGLTEDQRRHYFRVDGAKSNYAYLEEAEWFERMTYKLDNGDSVAVAVPWTPPADHVTLEVRSAVEAGIAVGTPTGPYSPRLSGDARSVRGLLVAQGVLTLSGQRKLLLDLKASGYLEQAFKRGNRNTALGLRAPGGLPNAAWINADAA